MNDANSMSDANKVLESTDDLIRRLDAERKVKTEQGEYCYRCGTWILCLTPPGYRRLCVQCRDVDRPGELDHSKFIRCPKCGKSWNPYDSEDFQVYESGNHDVQCDDCGHDFEVETSVSYSFTSPEMNVDEDEDDDEEDDEIEDVPDDDDDSNSNEDEGEDE